jgi:hypothetical protein
VAEEKSIAAAINDVTEEDLTGTQVESENDDTILEDPDWSDGGEGENEGEGEGEAQGEEGEGSEEGEVEGEGSEEGEGEGEGEEEDVTDILLDNLTPEEIERIKKDPGLNTLRHKLLSNYNKKYQKADQAVQLADEYEKDPRRVLEAIARANGATVSWAQQVVDAAKEKAEEATGRTSEQRAAVEEAGKDLEQMFGEKVGPKVRAVFDKYVGAMLDDKTAPLKDDVSRVRETNRLAALQSEEAQFRAEHDDMTPEEEKAVIALGNSGQFQPGPNQTPRDFLETLLTVVRAGSAKKSAKQAGAQASKDLAGRVRRNRQDREPRGRSGRGGTVKHVSKLLQPEKIQNMDEAFDIALQELKDEE